MSADVCFTKSECVSRYNRSGPRGAGNTGPGLTHSLDYGKERLMPNYTHFCSVDGCQNKVGLKGARGWCTKHYQRWLYTGSPTGSKKRPSAEQRFWAYTDKSDGCWHWRSAMDTNGYGLLSVGGKTTKAHRFAYELLVGHIPDGLVIDHLCRNRSCVNPDHMEPVTNDENLRRGNGRDVSQGRRGICHAGHPYSIENTYTNPLGRKVCRTCMAAARARYENRKAA